MTAVKKIFMDFAIVLSLAILLFSSWREKMEWMHRRDDWTGPLAPHGSLNGDLSGMAYLDGLAKFRTPVVYSFAKAAPDTGRVALWLHGDSFTRNIPDSSFAALCSYRYAWRFRNDLRYTLDTSAINVLVIETAERYVMEYFTQGHFFRHVYDSARGPAPGHADPGTPAKPFKDLPDGTEDFIWHASPNLEYLLFDYAFLDPVRHAKAILNYRFFSRASGDVVVSHDRQRLFLKETVAYDDLHSSYAPVSDADIQRIVDTLNAIHRHYSAEGFDTVLMSIIPNAATICQPAGYNGLIPRLQNHPHLEMPMLDAYAPFKAHPKPLFYRAETHWNNRGLQWWVGEVNKLVREMDARGKARSRRPE